MPIIATHILQARRAALEAQQRAAEQTQSAPPVPDAPAPEPPAPVEQAVTPPAPDKVPAGVAPEKNKAKRSKRAARPKKQPTGDYATGYCRPPVEHRFDGSKAGPGRPKASVSQNTIARKHLNKRRQVTVEGKTVNVTHRELIYMQRINAAITGKDRYAVNLALADALRLFPEEQLGEGGAGPTGADLTETGRAILDLFAEEIREEERNREKPT